VEIGPDDETVTFPLLPVAGAKGRLIDGETNEPMPGRDISCEVRVHRGDDNAPFTMRFGDKCTTGEDGTFEFQGLVVGQSYDVSVTLPKEPDRQFASSRRVESVMIE